jgi:uncharacterized Fe-S cluster-containing MiaB family protein
VNTAYPDAIALRDRWILARRAARNSLDPRLPYAFHSEEERAASGEVVSVATIFLTNRECPWRCLMCDLWQNTLTETVPIGAIPAQIDFALEALRAPAAVAEQARESQGTGRLMHQIKLYNSGSFFDSRAIPIEDHPAIAARVQSFERVIIECHPSLIGEAAVRFRNLLGGQASSLSPSFSAGQPSRLPPVFSASPSPLPPSLPTLEIAMGLETAHAEVLEKLNKRMTLDQFRHAAAFLRDNGIALRTFILIKPPFLNEAEALHWAMRSLDFAFDCGATAASLIPTRPGNGAMEALMSRGDFSPPRLATLEAVAEYGVSLRRGRVFADLWDLERFSDCAFCFPARRARLLEMNLRQWAPPAVRCPSCTAEGGAGETPALH